MQGCESVCPCPFVLKQRGVDSGHSDLLIPEIMALCEQRGIRTPSYKSFWGGEVETVCQQKSRSRC